MHEKYGPAFFGGERRIRGSQEPGAVLPLQVSKASRLTSLSRFLLQGRLRLVRWTLLIPGGNWTMDDQLGASDGRELLSIPSAPPAKSVTAPHLPAAPNAERFISRAATSAITRRTTALRGRPVSRLCARQVDD